MISQDLINVLKWNFRLNWNGIHGVSHWARVRNNGLRIAKENGANQKVVECFAFIHDSCRMSDGSDPDHGRRGAEFAKWLLGKYIHLTIKEFVELQIACIGHSDGLTLDESITVMTCWDADRLDLGRVGVWPNPDKLCTEAAKSNDIIQWAYNNSLE